MRFYFFRNLTFIFWLFLSNLALAQENIAPKPSNKKYETQAIKNQNQIEIRMVPKIPAKNEEIIVNDIDSETDEEEDKELSLLLLMLFILLLLFILVK